MKKEVAVHGSRLKKMNIEQHTPPKRLRRPGRTSNIEHRIRQSSLAEMLKGKDEETDPGRALR